MITKIAAWVVISIAVTCALLVFVGLPMMSMGVFRYAEILGLIGGLIAVLFWALTKVGL